jgi:glyceraldehyde-3-phosphate dehydrogenase (NADP+)
MQQLIHTIKHDPELYGHTISSSTNTYYIKRNPIGIVVCLAPYNYPINESYATIIPSLLMGNIVIVKIPTIGGLAHLFTMEAFAQALPPNTIYFVAGSGRSTMPILLQTGSIDALAFIGSKHAANQLIHIHPNPHRLKVFLQLEAKNMAIILPNVFEHDQVYENTMKEIITGTLSYNGQRCTALKLIFVPTLFVDQFIQRLMEMVHQMPIGLPWQNHHHVDDNGNDNQDNDNTATSPWIQSMITPLPSMERIHYMKELIQDAISKGAKVVNKKYGGGMIVGGVNSTLMVPAILYPVTSDMKLYHEEQFGPIIPIVSYENPDTIIQYGQNGLYGQQVSIFTNPNMINDDVIQYIDLFSTIFGKININTQCSRSPDTIPFSGRRSSAMGIMSVQHSLYEFSIPTVVSFKNHIIHVSNDNMNHNNEKNDMLWQQMQDKSIFLQPLS